jgi:hypothetical protein
LGSVQICWGQGYFGNKSGETDTGISFPAPFSAAPAVNVSISDTGYGVSSNQAGVGALGVGPIGFTITYKSNAGNPGDIYYSWTAIGRWN